MSVIGVKRHPLIIPPPFDGWAGQRLRAINPENRGASDTKEIPGATWMDNDTMTFGALLYIDRAYESQTDYDGYIIADRGAGGVLAVSAYDWTGNSGWRTSCWRDRSGAQMQCNGVTRDLPVRQWFFFFLVDNGAGNLPTRYVGLPGDATTEPGYGSRQAPTGTVTAANAWSIGSRANGSGLPWLGGMAWVCAWPGALTQVECTAMSKYWKMPVNLKPALELFPGMHTGSIVDATGQRRSAIANFSGLEMAVPGLWPPIEFEADPEVHAFAPASGLSLVGIRNETANITEALDRAKTMARMAAETLQVAEGIATAHPMVRLRGETVNVTEGLIDARAMARHAAEVFEVAEGLATARAMARLADETLQVAEGTEHTRGRRAVVDETAQLVEAIVTAKGQVALINETLNVTEGVLGLLFGALVSVINETLNVIEGAVRALGLARSVGETANITEATVTAAQFAAVVDELLNVTEATERARILARLINETTSLSEATVAARALARLVNETANVIEGVEHAKGLTAVVNEVIELAESLATVLSIFGATMVAWTAMRFRPLVDADAVRFRPLVQWSRTRLRPLVQWASALFRSK